MKSRNRGFSLVEVLCAVLILGVAVVGLTQGLATALGSNKESERQTTATFLAAGQIELLRADGYLKAGEIEGEGEGNLSTYKWKQSVTETKIEGLFEITIVIMQAATGQEIYELKTLLFDAPVIRDAPLDRRDKKRGRS